MRAEPRLFLAISAAIGPVPRPYAHASRLRAPAAPRLSAVPTWSELQAVLDASVPVFCLANAAAEPLQYDREGVALAVFFADANAARQELASADEKYPELGLRVTPMGLGTAFEAARNGRALLVPGAGELKAARDPDGGGWEDDALPLFGCLQMRKPLADGSSSVPLFMSAADAQAALGAAASGGGGDDLQIVCTSLARAVDMIVSGEQVDFSIVPPSASIWWMQAWQAGEPAPPAAEPPMGTASRLTALMEDSSPRSSGLFPG